MLLSIRVSCRLGCGEGPGLRGKTARLPSEEQPFVSIHLPCCDEPPEVVIRTLNALRQLDWARYEVLVLDNNTPSAATWKPVADHCATLGERFSFFHVAKLKGAKAGALNLCLERMDPRSELILTVDADYRIEPSALQKLTAALGPGISHVQAPQAYHASKGCPSLDGAFASYFERYAAGAGRRGAMLLTGTMSLMRVDALAQAGGWSAASITEDAELGVRLLCAGWRGTYLAEIVGRGQMPNRLTELRKQRRRWVHGNAQVLFRHFDELARLPRGMRIPVLAQLTAWFHPWALPVIGLALFLTEAHRPARLLLAATALTYMVVELALYLSAPRTLARPESSVWRRASAHFALGWEGALAWIGALIGVRLGFERTSKRAGRGRGSSKLRLMAAATAVGLGAFHGARSEPLVALSCLLLATLPLASHQLALALDRTGDSSRATPSVELSRALRNTSNHAYQHHHSHPQ